MSSKNRVAVLLTCHNRKDKTLRCLSGLKRQLGVGKFELKIFLVDDGSSDGTAEAVHSDYPKVCVIRGDGSLYWTGGMRLAMQWARRELFDYYIWLNDDTELYPDCLERLLTAYSSLVESGESHPIVTGNLCDPVTKKRTYGGSTRASFWQPLRFSKVEPGNEPRRCDVFNANCVLLPRAAVDIVGDLHSRLVHAAGDYEYGLRANRMGVTTWVAPGYCGECSRNPIAGTWVDMSLPLRVRYKKLFSIKGQPPIPRLIYYRRYGGVLWPVTYVLVYLRPAISSLLRLFGRG